MKVSPFSENNLFLWMKFIAVSQEIACVLEGREEFDEIHFVLDKNHIKHLDRFYIINKRRFVI